MNEWSKQRVVTLSPRVDLGELKVEPFDSWRRLPLAISLSTDTTSAKGSASKLGLRSDLSVLPSKTVLPFAMLFFDTVLVA